MTTKPGGAVTRARGTPLTQVIPIKREDRETETIVDEEGKKRDTSLKFFLTNAYARIFHRKKVYK